MKYQCSVIVPVYNTDSIFIRQALKSIKEQEEPVKAIIVDDGSTAKYTKQELNEWASSNPDWVFVRNRFNRGQAAARNRALSLVDTEYTAILDADDVWGKNKIDYQLAAMTKHKSVANICRTRIRRTTDGFNTNKVEVTTPAHLLEELRSSPISYQSFVMLSRFNASICGSNAVFRTKTLRQVQGFPKRWSGLDEWAALLEVLYYTPTPDGLSISSQAEVTYRRYDKSYSSTNSVLLQDKVEDYICFNRKRMAPSLKHYLDSPAVAIWAHKLSRVLEYEPNDRGIPAYGGL